MSEDMAKEIRIQEELAESILSNSRAEASKIVAEARTSAEQSVKEAKQKYHRFFRDEIALAEKEAESEAQVVLEKGQQDAELFYNENRQFVGVVNDWLIKEVMMTYGVS